MSHLVYDRLRHVRVLGVSQSTFIFRLKSQSLHRESQFKQQFLLYSVRSVSSSGRWEGGGKKVRRGCGSDKRGWYQDPLNPLFQSRAKGPGYRVNQHKSEFVCSKRLNGALDKLRGQRTERTRKQSERSCSVTSDHFFQVYCLVGPVSTSIIWVPLTSTFGGATGATAATSVGVVSPTTSPSSSRAMGDIVGS